MRAMVLSLSLLSVSVILLSCGSHDSSSELSVSGLESIPSVSSFVKSNGGSASSAAFIRNRGAVGYLDTHAVSGTPPTMYDLGNSSTLIDQAFFGGLILTINTAGSATADQANSFWKGQGACWLGQSAAEGIGRLIQTGTSMCYMKNIPSKTGAFTITSGSISDPSTIFNQQDSDRLVKIAVGGEGDQEDVWIRVHGKNSVGSDVYKVQLYFCTSGSVTGSETVTINKKTGVYTSTGDQANEGNNGNYSATAYLTTSGGSIAFDSSKDRTMSSHWNGNWGTYKGYLSINGSNEMTAKRYNSFAYSGQTNTDKNYSISSFTGTGVKTLKFLDGASKGSSTWNGEAHTYTVGTEYQDTRYMPVESGTKYDTAVAYDMSADEFFTTNLTLSTPTFAEDCSATPDIAGSINMQSAEMADIQATCEADRFDNYSMCNSSTIQSAQNKIFTSISY